VNEVKSEKMVSVRIKPEQARRLREITGHIPGSSINAVVQRAVQQWLEIEGPVYLEAFKQVKQRLNKERQAVAAFQDPRTGKQYEDRGGALVERQHGPDYPVTR
jgi:hypothetical protein